MFFGSVNSFSASYQVGNIQDRSQLEAAKKVRELEQEFQSVAKEMFVYDESDKDYNSGAKDKVAIDVLGAPRGSATRTPDNKIVQMDAVNYDGEYSVKTEGDKRTLFRRKEIEGSDGGSLFIDDWAIFRGDKVEFKSKSYFG